MRETNKLIDITVTRIGVGYGKRTMPVVLPSLNPNHSEERGF